VWYSIVLQYGMLQRIYNYFHTHHLTTLNIASHAPPYAIQYWQQYCFPYLILNYWTVACHAMAHQTVFSNTILFSYNHTIHLDPFVSKEVERMWVIRPTYILTIDHLQWTKHNARWKHSNCSKQLEQFTTATLQYYFVVQHVAYKIGAS
jgi:hypothetical protein